MTQAVIKQRNKLMLACALILLVLVGQTIYLLFSGTKVVVVPASESSILITGGKPAQEHLAGLAEFLAGEILNLSPANLELKMLRVAKYMTTNHYQDYLDYFGRQAQIIRKLSSSSYLQVESVKVDEDDLKAVIEGNLEQRVGTSGINTQRMRLKLDFTLVSGALKLQRFQVEKIDKDEKANTN